MQLIIPNWHPIFVHFTVALLISATGLFLVTALFPAARWRDQCRTVALWNLWMGVAITLVTVATGVYAFNTVHHDDPSHVIMLEHRNLALTSLGIFVVLAVLSWLKHSRQRHIGWVFTIGMLLGAGVLASTAWHGGELVFRHGLGVISLPAAGPHTHSHGDAGHSHDETSNAMHEHGDEHEHEHEGKHTAAPAAMAHDHDAANAPAAEQGGEHMHEHEDAHEHEQEDVGTTHVHPDGSVHTH